MVTSLFGTRPPPTSIELTHRTSNHPRGQAAWPVAAQCTTSWRSGQHIVVKLFYGKENGDIKQEVQLVSLLPFQASLQCRLQCRCKTSSWCAQERCDTAHTTNRSLPKRRTEYWCKRQSKRQMRSSITTPCVQAVYSGGEGCHH